MFLKLNTYSSTCQTKNRPEKGQIIRTPSFKEVLLFHIEDLIWFLLAFSFLTRIVT